MRKDIVFGVAIALMAIASTAPAATIYEHSFGGDAGSPLDGVAVDVGSGAWMADPAWRADGSVSIGAADPENTANAFLPLSVEAGRVYTLTASLEAFNADVFFLAAGFVNNPTLTTPHTHAIQGPWAYIRGNAPQPEYTYEVATSTGPDVGGGTVSAGNYSSGPQELQIVLDTRDAAWSAEWLVNGASVRTHTYAANPEINAVALSRYWLGVGQASSFSLTSVPEPSSVILVGLGLVGLAAARRRFRG